MINYIQDVMISNTTQFQNNGQTIIVKILRIPHIHTQVQHTHLYCIISWVHKWLTNSNF